MGPITSLRDLVSALRRRFWLMLLIVAVGVPFSVWFALSKERLYEATAVVQIEAPRVTEALAGSGGLTANNQLDLIEQHLMSRDNVTALLDRFEPFPDDLPMTERVGMLRGAISLTKIMDPSQAWRSDVQPTGLSITVRLGDPQKAADLANAMLDTIVTEARNQTEERANRTLDFLVGEENRIAAQIAAQEARISDFRQANVASLPEGLSSQRDRLLTLNESQLEIEQQLLGLQGGSDRLRPVDVTRQIDLLEQQLDLISERITSTEAAIASTPAVEQQLGALNRDLTQLEAEYQATTTKRTEAAMNQLLESQDQAARFIVLETAVVPDYAVSASRRKLAVAGSVLAVVVAVGVALALEVLNPAIRTAEQMQRQLGVQPVIVVPYLTEARKPGIRGPGILALVSAAALGIWIAIKSGLLDRFLPRARPSRNFPATAIPAE